MAGGASRVELEREGEPQREEMSRMCAGREAAEGEGRAREWDLSPALSLDKERVQRNTRECFLGQSGEGAEGAR
jgi:hypothetical protein